MKLVLDYIQQFNLNLILNNSYSLDGFMNKNEYDVTLNKKTLNNGIQFSIPIVLQIEEEKYEEIKDCKEVILCDEYNTHLAYMKINDFYQPNIEKEYKLYTKKFRNYLYYFGDNYYHVGGKVIANEKYNIETPTLNPDNPIAYIYPYDSDSTKYKKMKSNNYIYFPYNEQDILQEKLERLREIVIKKYRINNENGIIINHENRFGVNDLKNNKDGICLWFIGLSGSGKTTLANAVKNKLLEINPNRKIVHIDGDKNVNIIFKQYSLSNQTKLKNRNWATLLSSYRVCEFIKDTNTIVIVTTTTPFYKPRLYNKWLIEKYGKYIEIFMDTPINICKERDSKGLYKKVENGEITNFVGIHHPFEKENTSDVIISDFNIEQNIQSILNFI